MTAPRRPGDIPATMRLPELAGRCDEHARALRRHRQGVGDPLPDEQRGEHILAVLAYQAAIEDRTSQRWPYAVEALSLGLSLETVAAAVGLCVDALRLGVQMRVTEQHRLGLLDEQRREAVLALVAGGCPDCWHRGPPRPLLGIKPGWLECNACGASWELAEPAPPGGAS